jgi:hypothetical protein
MAPHPQRRQESRLATGATVVVIGAAVGESVYAATQEAWGFAAAGLVVALVGARSLSGRVRRTQAKTPLAEIQVENYELDDDEAGTANPRELPPDRDS